MYIYIYIYKMEKIFGFIVSKTGKINFINLFGLLGEK